MLLKITKQNRMGAEQLIASLDTFDLSKAKKLGFGDYKIK